jgi:ubiquinone biosynthesis protein
MQFVLEPAFARGVFHADPHPGNLLVQADDSLTVIDFGKVGHLTPVQRRRVADLFVAMNRSDAQRITDRLIDLTTSPQPVDRALIATDIDRMLALYVNVSLEKVRVGDALGELLQLGRRYRLRLPGNLVQFFKALAMCEGMLLAIEPDASFTDFLRPMAGKMLFEGFAGQNGIGLLRDSALDAVELGLELPQRIDRVLGEIERGNLRVLTRVEDMEPLVKRLERMAARTNAAMLVAACIVGLALVIPIYHPPGWETWNNTVFWIAVAAVVTGSMATLWRLLK